MRNPSSNGFSLPELLVAVVIGAFLLMATYQILVTQQRVSAVQSAQVQAQQTIRAGLDVLSYELREVSRGGGDLITMAPTSVTVRTMRGFGVTCTIEEKNPPRMIAWVEGRPFTANDRILIFADGSPNTATDDDWIQGEVQSVEAGLTCGSGANARPALRVRFTGNLMGTGVDRVNVGAVLRAVETVTYELRQFDGESFLARVEADGTAVPLVGPVAPDAGVSFEYLDEAGLATAVAADVRQIRVSLQAVSNARRLVTREPVSETLASTIFLRN